MGLSQTIKKMAYEAIMANNPLQFIEGEVLSPPPNIKIRLKNNPKLDIPSDFIRVSEHLTKHIRMANISSSDGIKSTKIEFTDELKKGDKVMVAAIQGGQSFFIIDRSKG